METEYPHSGPVPTWPYKNDEGPSMYKAQEKHPAVRGHLQVAGEWLNDAMLILKMLAQGHAAECLATFPSPKCLH